MKLNSQQQEDVFKCFATKPVEVKPDAPEFCGQKRVKPSLIVSIPLEPERPLKMQKTGEDASMTVNDLCSNPKLNKF